MKLLSSLVITFLFSFNLFASSLTITPYDQSALDQKLLKFQSLVERNLVWRTKTTKVVTSMLAQRDAGKAFKSKDIRMLSEFVIPEYDLLQKELFQIIGDNLWMADEKTNIQFSDKPTDISKASGRVVAKLNPYDAKGTFYFLHGLNSLASSTLLTDNYLLVFSQLQSNKKIREIVRYEIPGYEQFLIKLNDQFSQIDNYIQFSASMKLFQKFRQHYKLGIREVLFDQPEFQYLFALIKNSYSLGEVLKDGSLGKFETMSKQAKKRFFKDRVRKWRDNRVYDLSKAFGNFAGKIRWGKGDMLDLPSSEVQKIKTSLQPLDILLEKTGFALTDKFIPGHYGHVAVWIGTKNDLQNLGIWNHPDVLPFQKDIEKGKGIVEALRPGVQINTVKSFMNIDDLAVLRLKNSLTDLEKATYIVRALKQIGKDYDFNFDVETPSKLICSELVYMVYEDFDWEVDKTLGRYTISPVHVAKRAIGPEPFELKTLYHKGKLIRSKAADLFKSFIIKQKKSRRGRRFVRQDRDFLYQ
jgi:hypothetical protein